MQGRCCIISYLGEGERLLGIQLALALRRRSGRSRNGSGDHEAEEDLAEEMHRSSLARAGEGREYVECRKGQRGRQVVSMQERSKNVGV